jgi:hypothetical protein
MSSEMIERVMKAIEALGPMDVANYQNRERMARAAIEAMRKPTQAMIDAGLAEVSDVTVADPKAAAWDAIRFHGAMISAALSSPAEDMSEWAAWGG